MTLQLANVPTGNNAYIGSPTNLGELANLQDSTNQPMAKPAMIANAPLLPSTNVTPGVIFTGLWSDMLWGVRESVTIEQGPGCRGV